MMFSISLIEGFFLSFFMSVIIYLFIIRFHIVSMCMCAGLSEKSDAEKKRAILSIIVHEKKKELQEDRMKEAISRFLLALF